MSRYYGVHTAANLAGIEYAAMSREELRERFRTVFEKGLHGISFSAYLEGQAPGSEISEGQVRERLEILRPHVQWVRSFSCTEGNEHIPRIAHELGMKTLVGAWLGSDAEKNENEITALIALARAGHADIIAVGNEVLLRGDLSEDEIVAMIERVKREVPGIPVGYVDAYFEFALHPRIVAVSDVVLANCYPFWEGYAIDHAHLYLKEMYRRARAAAQGKPVIIAETGWPNQGSPDREAVPSFENAVKYFVDTITWAAEEDIAVFYFASFDEAWKIGSEGDVGAYWGLWDKDGNPKYH